MAGDHAEPTLREVARLAGVHVGTASRALSGERTDLVATDTLKRVQAAAKQLGYRPNPIARGLKTRRSYTVGLLIPDLTNPLYPPIARGVEDALAEHGYTPLIGNTDNEQKRETALVETLRQRHVDGFIVATARRKDPLLKRLQRAGTPLVLVLRGMDDAAMWAVLSDDRGAMRDAVAHLVELGHERIAHVAGPQDVWNGYERHQGFLAAMAEHGLHVDERLVVGGARFTIAEGAAACAKLLAADKPFTAVIAGNDLMAIGCIKELASNGARCPRDVSIVGVNDMPLAELLTPPLTTVRLAQYEMGRVATMLLLERFVSADAPARRELMPTELVIRGSTARAPRRRR